MCQRVQLDIELLLHLVVGFDLLDFVHFLVKLIDDRPVQI